MTYNGTVLVIDDEPHIRKFIIMLLRHLGVDSVFEAPNGVAGVELYQKEKPGLVLLDVNMPVMDGIETLRQLKQVDPDCLVVMLTSLANRQTIEEAAEAGAANYIRKDVPMEELGAALAEMMEVAEATLQETAARKASEQAAP